MRAKDTSRSGGFFLPRWKGVQWTWKRWLLLGLATLPFIDQFLMPVSRWDQSRGEGVLFLILGFRAAARSEPPPAVLIAGGCLVALGVATGHGFIREVSPVWTPIEFALLLFIFLSWRRGTRRRREPGTRVISD